MSKENAPEVYESVSETSSQPAAAPVDLRRMLNLRGPLIIGVALVLAIVGGAAIFLLLPYEYTSRAQFRILATAPRIIQDGSMSMNPGALETYINTQVNLMSGNAVLQRTLENPAINEISFIANASSPLAYLRSRVSSDASRRTELINVQCTMPSAEDAQTVLREIVAQYQGRVRAEDASEGGERSVIIEAEQAALQEELDLQVAALVQLNSKLDHTLESEGSEYRRALLNAEEVQARLQAEAAEIEDQIDRVARVEARYNTDPIAPIYEFGIEEQVRLSSNVTILTQQMAQEEITLDELRERYQPSSAILRSQERKFAKFQTSVKRMEASVREGAVATLRPELESQLGTKRQEVIDAAQRTQHYSNMLELNIGKIGSRVGLEVEIEDLESKIRETRRRHSDLESEITDIRVESKAAARITLVAEPSLPENPDYSRHIQAFALLFLGSIGAGVAAGAIREVTDQEIRSAADIRRITNLPVLASIPDATEDRSIVSPSITMVASTFPNSPMVEEFRKVIVPIMYPTGSAEPLKSIMVASPSFGDGKTALACNLAIVLTQANRRVLVVDFNAHKPAVERGFNLEPAPGLSEVLDGTSEASALVRTTDVPNLSVIGPGSFTAESTARLSSIEMSSFLEWARKEYDHVILVTRSVLLTSEPKLLAPLVDGVIVVVAAGVSTTGMTRRCISELEQADAQVVGIVLNRIRTLRGGYLSDNLKIFHEYSSDNNG